MNIKEKLISTLKRIEDNMQNHFRINDILGPYKITFFSGYKPAGYFVPQMVFSTKQALEENDKFHIPAWFGEIFVNGKCIFRECRIPVSETDKEIEEKVLNDLFTSLIAFAVLGEYDMKLKRERE
jgi:hypothetical protein